MVATRPTPHHYKRTFAPSLTQIMLSMTNVTLNAFELADLEQAVENVLERKLKSLIPQQRPEERPVLLTRKDTAKYLHISLPTLHDWTKTGIITAHRISNRVLYKMEEVNEALQKIRTANEGLRC